MERAIPRKEYPRIVLPREHGAWAMFIVPLLVGIGTAWSTSIVSGALVVRLALFAIAAFGFFLLRYPMMMAVKSRTDEARSHALTWSAAYGSLTGAASLGLIMQSALWLLVPLAALGLVSLCVYLWYAARRAEMSTFGEWIGIGGLALGAPGAYLVATGHLDQTAIALYILNLLYFGGTVSYVKFRVREQRRVVTAGLNWGGRIWGGRVTLAYHALVAIAAACLAWIGFIPLLAALVFVLPLCKVAAGVSTIPGRLNMARLGLTELAFSTAFAVIVLLAYSR